MVNVTTAVTHSLFGEKSLGQASQQVLMWAKLLQENCSLFLSLSCLLLPTCVVSGHLWANSVLCGVLLAPHQTCVLNSCWCGSGPRLELAAHSLLPSWESHPLFFRKGADSVDSSSAPRPVPENRFVTCPVHGRWMCHMPLKVVLQLSLTLWMNSFCTKALTGKKSEGR